MEINDFVAKFANAVEDIGVQGVTADTNFKNLAGWSSLAALSIIAMVDEEFDVQLKGADIRNANTIQDLYKLINAKQ
jgi:acyl carrier protein